MPYSNSSWTFRGNESFISIQDFKDKLIEWGIRFSQNKDMQKHETEQIKQFYHAIEEGKEGLRVYHNSVDREEAPKVSEWLGSILLRLPMS